MTPTSPFARKVRIVLAEKRIEYEQVVDSPWKRHHVPDYNPLGMVPVLVLDDNHTLFDSPRDRRISRHCPARCLS